MQHFPESDLVFAFPDDWRVRKFDTTSAFRSLSGHGLKGVDFLALDAENQLWFVEVKNYRPRFKAEKEHRAKRPAPAVLADQLATKFRDSHRLIRVVAGSLGAKWFASYRYPFWTAVLRVADNPERCRYVVWLETPEIAVNYEEELSRRLAASDDGQFSATMIVESARESNLPFGTI